ncbi:MAG: hypothetical protein ACI30C_01240 [Muribaculaceae bacterium]
MKRFILIFTAFALTASALCAQRKIDPAKAEEVFNAKVKYMQEQLLLTPEQTEKFIPIYKEFLNEVREIKRPAKPQKEDEIKSVDEAAQVVIDRINYHRAVLDAQEKCIGKLKSVLTAPQLMKFIKCEKAMQSKISRFKDGKRTKRQRGEGGPKKECANTPSCNKTPSSN